MNKNKRKKDNLVSIGRPIHPIDMADKDLPPEMVINEKNILATCKPETNAQVVYTDDGKEDVHSFLSTGEEDVRKYLIRQLVTSLPDFSRDDMSKIVTNSMALINGINPRDQVEAMIAVQMIAIHNLAMELIKTASRGDNGMRIDHYTNLANKAMRTFTMQMEILGKYRNKGKQKIIVEHVTVNAGGQAIVGSEIN